MRGRSSTAPPDAEGTSHDRTHYGAPDWEVAGWISGYLAIASRVIDVVTDDVERLTGHPPQDLPEYRCSTPDAWAHLRVWRRP